MLHEMIRNIVATLFRMVTTGSRYNIVSTLQRCAALKIATWVKIS